MMQDIGCRCLGEWATFASVAAAQLPAEAIFNRDPGEGLFRARFAENSPRSAIVMSVLIRRGAPDDLAPPEIQAAFVTKRCAAGQAIDYRTYPDRDHLSLVAADSPLGSELIAWTKDRFAGQASRSGC
jgi:hypothetical protein